MLVGCSEPKVYKSKLVSVVRKASREGHRCAALVPSWQECKQELARCHKYQPLLLPKHLPTFNTSRSITLCNCLKQAESDYTDRALPLTKYHYSIHFFHLALSEFRHCSQRATLPFSTTTCARISSLGIRHRPQCPS